MEISHLIYISNEYLMNHKREQSKYLSLFILTVDETYLFASSVQRDKREWIRLQ